MVKKYKYAVIGKNWGSKINSILLQLNKDSLIFDLDYKKINLKDYYFQLKNFILENKIDIIWLAIPPKNHYKLTKFILECNTNLIIEKPVLFNLHQKKIINTLLNKKKLFLSVHFEYIFLKDLLLFNKNLQFDSIEYIFNHSNKKKSLSATLDLGIHLMAIKKLYFDSINNYKIQVAFNAKNKRQINFKLNNKLIYKINFTKSKEKIIQAFIKYYEIKVMKNIENKLDLNFSYIVYKELNLNNNQK